MLHEEGVFVASQGVRLYRQAWRLGAARPRAVVVIVHGVGEHSGRYQSVVDPLVHAGYDVWAFDQRGHGRSPGTRVHVDRWAEYREDLAAFLEMVAVAEPGVPVFLYGHSMGALVVLEYLVTRGTQGLAGAIISGAPIDPVGIGSPALITVARTLSGIAPRMSVGLNLDLNALSRDQAVVAAYGADPLVHPKATVRWGTESLGAVDRVKAGMSAIDIPVLVLHGGADSLNSAEGARLLYEAMSSGDKTLIVYADGRHEPHNDVCRGQVAADVVDWLEPRARAGESA